MNIIYKKQDKSIHQSASGNNNTQIIGDGNQVRYTPPISPIAQEKAIQEIFNAFRSVFDIAKMPNLIEKERQFQKWQKKLQQAMETHAPSLEEADQKTLGRLSNVARKKNYKEVPQLLEEEADIMKELNKIKDEYDIK